MYKKQKNRLITIAMVVIPFTICICIKELTSSLIIDKIFNHYLFYSLFGIIGIVSLFRPISFYKEPKLIDKNDVEKITENFIKSNEKSSTEKIKNTIEEQRRLDEQNERIRKQSTF
jgi:hypothetical protein